MHQRDARCGDGMCSNAGQIGRGEDVQMQWDGDFFEISAGYAADDPGTGGISMTGGDYAGICRCDGGGSELIAQGDERWVGVVFDEEGLAGERCDVCCRQKTVYEMHRRFENCGVKDAGGIHAEE